MQKGGWYLPCKEPLGWLLLLKKNEMIHSSSTLLRACVENNKRPLSSTGRIWTSTPSWQICHPVCNVTDWLGAISNTSPPFLLVMWGMLQSTGEKAKRLGFECMFVCECKRVGTWWNRKPRQTFTLVEFPASKMCITVFQLENRKDEGGELVLSVCWTGILP